MSIHPSARKEQGSSRVNKNLYFDVNKNLYFDFDLACWDVRSGPPPAGMGEIIDVPWFMSPVDWGNEELMRRGAELFAEILWKRQPYKELCAVVVVCMIPKPGHFAELSAVSRMFEVDVNAKDPYCVSVLLPTAKIP